MDIEIKQALWRLHDEYAAYSAAGIVDELSAVIFSGGKRMRPLLCCRGHEACGGKIARPIIRVAASLELLHTFAIVHDDIMDSAQVRRRRLPAHSKVAGEQPDLGSQAAGRFGLSTAMLAGDLALVASDKLFVESGFEPERLAAAWKPLSQMRLDAVAGQYLDLSLSGKEIFPETAAGIARLKSGSYSVRGPLAVGAVLAGESGVALRALETFGNLVGEAFQLADDLSGMFGDPEVSGKDAESDLAQGKPTLLIALALQLASPDARKSIEAAWNNPEATPGQIQTARRAIAASGAPARVVDRIRRLVSEAQASVEDPLSKNLQPGPVAGLLRLADHIVVTAG